MVVFPPAKINLGLRILCRRSDGYHDIETLFYPIPLTDILEVFPSEQGMLYDFGDTWSEEEKVEDNLVAKAYQLLAQEVELPDVELILRKRIPTGAGLGGGSSDAAYTLRLLCQLFELSVPNERLHTIAQKLGADVPFFLKEEPQLGEGIGTELTPFPLGLSGYHLTLVFPPIHISTPEAYADVTPNEDGKALPTILRQDISTWCKELRNDFEPSIFARYPMLKRLKEELYQSGAIYASMSGSGATFYALSESPLDLEKIPYSHTTFLL